MNTKSITITLLSLSLVATAMGQNVRPRPVPARPAVPAPSPLPARSTRLSGMISRPSIPTTAKSDDLIESPATNVVKGAFGYTLGAIWDEPIPDGATTNKEGEITFPVEPKSALEPFSSVKLSLSTNDHRLAAIAGETPRMILAESYCETSDKIDQIANKLFSLFSIGSNVSCLTNDGSLVYNYRGAGYAVIVSGKLYREYLTLHPNDPDFTLLKDIKILPRFHYTIHPIAGSRYNEEPVNRSDKGKPDYLQQIWQPFELSASYYPYAGEAVIRFSVRDIEDRTEHTNLVTVAELKKGLSSGSAGGSPATSKSIEDDGSPSNSTTTINGQREAGEPPALRQGGGYASAVRIRNAQRTNDGEGAVATPTNAALKKVTSTPDFSQAEQEFKDSLHRLSFAEAVEKAKNNDPEALLRLAVAYCDGEELKTNYAEARKYLEKACEQNYPYAQYVIGMARSGLSNDWSHDDRRSMAIRRRLRALGMLPAALNIYHMDRRDIGERKLFAESAIHFLNLAVSNGVCFAQGDLEFAKKDLQLIEEEEYKRQQADELKRRNEELLKGNQGE